MAARVQSRLVSFVLLAALLALTWSALPAFTAGSTRSPAFRTRSVIARRAATEETMAKVADVVAEQLGVDTAKVTREATLTELGADSLDIVESVMALEEAFDVELPDEETTELKNCGDVADLIQKKL
eukprot:CAMPEP_0197874222 /NCGR_PEP_ID=MMETSP1439-20131203/3807_1 /TAXON_ID=66791 /ORGANISM="Gonyaulax spinifera, Strain CCMP409" /LENGTH=126 /DNA_ID=CAMNT_0043493321 /DNA_START=90 /DNA_END=470 /DNA_ORIENTATION=+